MKKGRGKAWTAAEERELTRRMRARESYDTIAAAIGRTAVAVQVRAIRLRLTPPVGTSNAKHKHLRESAMAYYLTHSFGETAERFGLTLSELKSLMTSGYRDPTLRHLRKETRRHDAWSFDETMLLLRAAGVQPRTWIARRLDRGTKEAVKEQMARLGVRTRYVNGIPLTWLRELVGCSVEAGFKVKAGSGGGGRHGRGATHTHLVPWVQAWPIAALYDAPEHLVEAFRAMARFQMKIHGTRTISETVVALRRILSEE